MTETKLVCRQRGNTVLGLNGVKIPHKDYKPKLDRVIIDPNKTRIYITLSKEVADRVNKIKIDTKTSKTIKRSKDLQAYKVLGNMWDKLIDIQSNE